MNGPIHASALFENLLVDPANATNPLTQSASRRFAHTKRGDEPLVALLNHVFDEAVSMSASDVHFQDAVAYTTIRYRVNGVLRDIYFLHREAGQEIDEKMRARCKLDPTERLAPLDGKFMFDLGDRMLEVRVSVLQTKHGQSIVCRLLDQANAGRSVDAVHMRDDVRETFLWALGRSEGLALVSGPTGSGKTSTLYAGLNHLNERERHIVTAEDPIEYDLPGTTQVQVEPPQRSYAKIMRSFLRQDFDAGLIGETRDHETAAITVEASNTGHMMMTTIHTNSGPSVVTRMLNLGVEPYAFGSAIVAILSQRLLRKLCDCRIDYSPSDTERTLLAARGIPVDRPFFRANRDGCPKCRPKALEAHPLEVQTALAHRLGVGFRGRVPVIAILRGTNELRTAIQRVDYPAIMAACLNQPQYRSLPVTALDLCTEGLVDFHEALAVSEGDAQ
ncbi:GspE/PulE family protein [Burkholderia anthina]|uniref:GspE/PulE family protein n=1 Tax=Burkholderia anthina TaxID=179879 RepID=UPI001588ADA0|nr:ATPase, T2SS/T4P/T4SS family [Burkholderia anthina]